MAEKGHRVHRAGLPPSASSCELLASLTGVFLSNDERCITAARVPPFATLDCLPSRLAGSGSGSRKVREHLFTFCTVWLHVEALARI